MSEHIGDATYCPEDNKLRLYAYSRLPKDVYSRIKAAGFKWAPKQELFVAPSWSPQREDILIELCGGIGDEDYSPEERAADRAERFAGYLEKRKSEALDSADSYQSGPSAIGYQSAAKAEREAEKHNRKRVFALDQWRKAEYWQQRTKAVIAHALYKSDPRVRRGRILELEAELRQVKSRYTPQDGSEYTDSDGVVWVAVGPKGRGTYFERLENLESIRESYSRWVEHLEFRIEYERAMLADEGGTAAEADIVPGGFIRGLQVATVKKSPVTGRVTSVEVISGENRRRINVERLAEGAYSPPSEEQLRAFLVAESERKKAQKEERAKAPKGPQMINPSEEDARRLQAEWNRHYPKPSEIVVMDQERYTSLSAGTYARCGTVEIDENFRKRSTHWGDSGEQSRKTVFKIRAASSGEFNGAPRVIVLSDKPTKPIPWDEIRKVRESMPTPQKMFHLMGELSRICRAAWKPKDGTDRNILDDAIYCKLAWSQSQSQFGLTELGIEWLRKFEEVVNNGGTVEKDGCHYPASLCVNR